MMFKLIQNTHLYAPEDKGMNDLLICGEKIACIAKKIFYCFDFITYLNRIITI